MQQKSERLALQKNKYPALENRPCHKNWTLVYHQVS